MFRSRLRIPRVGGLAQRVATPAAAPARSIHQIPHNVAKKFNPEEGVPGLLTADGFDIAWTQHMTLMMEKLNALTAGTDYEQMEIQQIVKQTARQAHEASIFNHASMAFNNHLFFEGMRKVDFPEDAVEPPASNMSEKLQTEIKKNFSSVETLRLEFVATALAMFGPGFIWLVKNSRSTEWRILTTYLAGSPLTAAHWRRQPVDLNGHGSDLSDEIVGSYLGRTQAALGSPNAGRFVKDHTGPGGIEVTPVLCLNTWQHVWLRDYGLGAGGLGGKRQFVENWWHVIDWQRVEELADLTGRNNFK